MRNSLLASAFLVALGASCSDRGHNQTAAPVSAISSAQASTAFAASALDTNIFVELAKKVVPSVVNISTAKRVKSPFLQGAPDDAYRRFFEDFFGQNWQGRQLQPGFPPSQRKRPGLPEVPKATSLGTGFVIDASGLILTNNHVVADADEIKIAFTEDPAEKPVDGEIVGRDPQLDVALIRVKTKRTLVPLPMGNSDALEVGEYVMAAGNPFGQGHSVSHGIVSAKGRNVPGLGLANYLQTDAPINPGNSGGPLVNLRGEVIGINNAILANAQGIGFAIPINSVSTILPQLKSKGSVDRGYLGALVGEMSPALAERLGLPDDIRGAFVTNVTPGGPAEDAGIKPYDLIVSVDGKDIRSANELVMAITAAKPGDSVKIDVNRAGKTVLLAVKVGTRPVEGALIAKKIPQKSPEQSNTGMSLEELTPETARRLGVTARKGVYVSSVEADSPADRAGLMRGDVILEVDRKSIKTRDEFDEIVRGGKAYLVRIRRSDSEGNESFSVIVLDLK